MFGLVWRSHFLPCAPQDWQLGGTMRFFELHTPFECRKVVQVPLIISDACFRSHECFKRKQSPLETQVPIWFIVDPIAVQKAVPNCHHNISSFFLYFILPSIAQKMNHLYPCNILDPQVGVQLLNLSTPRRVNTCSPTGLAPTPDGRGLASKLEKPRMLSRLMFGSSLPVRWAEEKKRVFLTLSGGPKKRLNKNSRCSSTARQSYY